MILSATRVTEQTCVGVLRSEYPLDSGNCFSVLCTDGKAYRIVNFVLENLEEAVRRGIAWPIRVKVLCEGRAVIHDERIPDDWYSRWFCEVCCPRKMLPAPQLLAHERQIARGERAESLMTVRIDTSKRPTL